MKCTAKSKRTGKRCGANAVTGRDVCYHHGGKTPQGISLPQTKSGRYSKHLPTRLLSTYEAANGDPDILALRDEVALIDARLAELLTRIDTGETGASWRELQEAFRELRIALKDRDPGESQLLLGLGDLIESGASDEAAWTEIRATLEQRRRLVESERKRLVEMQQMVGADQAMLLVRSLVASVREHVRDPAILRAITDDLGKLALARAD